MKKCDDYPPQIYERSIYSLDIKTPWKTKPPSSPFAKISMLSQIATVDVVSCAVLTLLRAPVGSEAFKPEQIEIYP